GGRWGGGNDEPTPAGHWYRSPVTAMSVGGGPMFPAASACSPAPRNRCATSAVVVVLPFVPVIAMQRVPDPASARNPRSISDTTGTPAARAAASGAASGGTPGETTTPAADRIFARSWRPRSTSTPASPRSSATVAPPYVWSEVSLAYMLAPSRASSFVAATPLFHSHTTATTLLSRLNDAEIFAYSS